jgi:sulfite oxidase
MGFVDPTQRAEGDSGDWINEPVETRHKELLVHTLRPYNAEPPNHALCHMITPETLHYRRTHTPVPLFSDIETEARVTIGFEEDVAAGTAVSFSQPEIAAKFGETADIACTLMCSGNRRSEYNNPEDGETMGLPWRNGSISTARWQGCYLREVFASLGFTAENTLDRGYNFVTLKGSEDYHISVPLDIVFSRTGDVTMAWKMNGQVLPRDHGYPLRMIVPGYVGARAVKWLAKVIISKEQTDGMHQRGIAYKQLAPNIKAISAVTKQYIEDLPPIDHVPVLSAICYPEPDQTVSPGQKITLKGYGYSGAGLAIIRVDVSVDGGKTWSQAEAIKRADATQKPRSKRAWAWSQWEATVTIPKETPIGSTIKIVSKAVDDQYNQQPNDPKSIWNLRGILNTAWGNVTVKVGSAGPPVSPEAASGDGSLANVGMKLEGTHQCKHCRQKFCTEKALNLHWKFIHDPNRLMEE